MNIKRIYSRSKKYTRRCQLTLIYWSCQSFSFTFEVLPKLSSFLQPQVQHIISSKQTILHFITKIAVKTQKISQINIEKINTQIHTNIMMAETEKIPRTNSRSNQKNSAPKYRLEFNSRVLSDHWSQNKNIQKYFHIKF